MLRKTPVAMAVSAAAAIAAATTPPAFAQEAAHKLDEITVSTTRTERKTDSVPNTVSVYTAKELKARNARDLKELLEGEVDLSLRASATRFTAAGSSLGRARNEGMNVRGLEGNQVLMMVDGIRQPLGFSFGAFASGRADYLDVATLSRIEVLRGPASAQFGSDGLAGALSLTTLAPEDLLKNGKKTFAGFVDLSYATVDSSANVSTAVAGATGDWQGLMMLTHRRGHETENQGTNESANVNRTAPNPEDIRSNSVLAKAGFKFNAQHRLMATLEGKKRDIATDALSARAVSFSTTTPTAVVSLAGEDHLKRARVSLEHRYEDLNAPWLQSLKTQVYVQDSKTRQSAAEDRYVSADRTRNGHYQEQLIGLSSQGQTQLSGQLASQRLSYGLDLSRNRIEALRDGTVPPAGETFPNKPFPDTTYTLAGAFVQSEIETGDVSFIPALRFDHYSLKPKAAGYVATAVALSDQALTPRLGLVWRATPGFQPYAQWALGFRAPTPDQVNNAFSNPTQGYTSIGNPGLKAEQARSIEVGVRGKATDDFRWQLSAYDNRYEDFIFQDIVRGTGAPGNPLVFQYINLNEARIKGLEARVVWQVLPSLQFNGAWARSRGHTVSKGVQTPLDTVQPERITLAARFEAGPWKLSATWQQFMGKNAADSAVAANFRPAAFHSLDLGGSYAITPSLRVAAYVTNATDSKYWRWSDVRGIAANSPVLDIYTAPGRQFQLSLQADF